MADLDQTLNQLLARLREAEDQIAELKRAETPVFWDGVAATIPQTGWITPTLINGWSNFGSGWATMQYRRDSLGMVHIKGFITGGTVGAAAFILPVGYRPTENSMYPSVTASGGSTIIGRIDVYPAGDVLLNVGGNTWATFNGVRFATF
jgi:hypothetical protein